MNRETKYFIRTGNALEKVDLHLAVDLLIQPFVSLLILTTCSAPTAPVN